MRFQSNQANCGPAALRNALQCHGISRAEQELERLTGCTAAEGTTPRGILKALALVAKDHPEITPGVISEGRETIALLRLLEALRNGNVGILLVDDWDHWVVAFGLLGGGKNIRIHLSDSADSELIQHHSPQSLINRWKGQGRKPYYGIVV
jgi:hypothetical protein